MSCLVAAPIEDIPIANTSRTTVTFLDKPRVCWPPVSKVAWLSDAITIPSFAINPTTIVT
jgi:hypothetical protein